MPFFSEQSKQKLLSCDPRLQVVLFGAIEVVDFTIIQGHRGEAEQNEAFRTGKSKLPWPKGNHNAYPSRAVDIAPVYYVAGKMQIDWNDLIAFGRIMGVVQSIAYAKRVKLRFGLDWDGDFRSVNRDDNESFLDAPHVELVDP